MIESHLIDGLLYSIPSCWDLVLVNGRRYRRHWNHLGSRFRPV